MTTKTLTRNELLEQPWAETCTITLHQDGAAAIPEGLLNALGLEPHGEKVEAIAIQFSAIINWYAIKASECPIDGTEWTWSYGDGLPNFTSAESMRGRTDPRDASGFDLLRSRHRGFAMKCQGGCAETYFLHNFERGHK